MVLDVTEVSEQAFFASHLHEQPKKPRPKNLDESLGFIRGIHHSRWSWTNFFTISTGLGHFWVFALTFLQFICSNPKLCCKRPSFVCRTVKPSVLLVICFFFWGVILTSSFWSAKSQFCFVKSTRSGAAAVCEADSTAQFRSNVDFHAVFGDDLGISGAFGS